MKHEHGYFYAEFYTFNGIKYVSEAKMISFKHNMKKNEVIPTHN